MPLLPLPPPYAERYEVFVRHYLYHQSRRAEKNLSCLRPTLGELTMTSGLKRGTCRLYRRQLEDEIRQVVSVPPKTPATQ